MRGPGIPSLRGLPSSDDVFPPWDKVAWRVVRRPSLRVACDPAFELSVGSPWAAASSIDQDFKGYQNLHGPSE